MDFFYTIKITKGRVINLKELSLQNYIQLQKICVMSDDIVFESFCKKLIKELCIDGDIDEINQIDLFLCVMGIYGNSISSDKKFNSYKEGKRYEISASILEMCDKVYDRYTSLSKTDEIFIGNGLVKCLDTHAVDTDYFIKNVVDQNGKFIQFSSEMLRYLDATTFMRIHDAQLEAAEGYRGITLVSLTDKEGREQKIEFELSLPIILAILRIFIKEDLTNIYKTLYILKADANLSYIEYDHLSYSEYQLFIRLHNNRVEEMNEQNERSDASPFPK